MIDSEKKIEKLIKNLLDEMEISPGLSLKKEVDVKSGAGDFQKKTEQRVYSIQDSVDDLRLCMKYLLFDLDATRRENTYYKRLLENKDI